MKFIPLVFVLVSLQVSAQQADISMEYHLQLMDNSIHVELQYTPLEPDSTIFTYGQPAFGGQHDILKGLQQLTVEAPATMVIDSANRKISLYFPSNAPLQISYDIVDTRTEASTRSQLFRPMILPDYIFVHGINLFLSPQFRDKEIKTHVSVQWTQLPALPLFYTFDPDNDGSLATVTTADSIMFRFITGAKDLQIKKFESESGTNYLVLRSSGISEMVLSEVKQFYNEYNRTMRQYWQDTRIIKYSLVLQPFLGVDHKISGVSFGNGFIGKYDKPDSLVLGERKFVIAHEIGHYYLGDLKAQAGNNNEGQWFDEGFNDYTTYFNLLRSNNMTAGEFEEGINKVFEQLYLSPIKNTPNEKIFENFWKLGDHAKLPYWRGCVFAFYLDNQISLASKNKYSLRDLMLNLKQLVKNRAEKEFTNEEFIQIASQFLPNAAIEKTFKEYILNGSSIKFKNDMLLPYFSIENIDGVPTLKIIDKKRFIAHYQFN